MTEKSKRADFTLEFKLEEIRWYKTDTSIPSESAPRTEFPTPTV